MLLGGTQREGSDPLGSHFSLNISLLFYPGIFFSEMTFCRRRFGSFVSPGDLCLA